MKIPQEHRDTVLELAYLITAADGRLDDAELEAFRKIAGNPSEKELDKLLDRFAGSVSHVEIEERVRELAKKLPADLKEDTFKLAVKLSLADMDQSPEEEDIQDTLIEAMGLSADRADELTAEVYGSLDAGGDE